MLFLWPVFPTLDLPPTESVNHGHVALECLNYTKVSPLPLTSHLDLGTSYCSFSVDLFRQLPSGVFVWGQGRILTHHQRMLTELRLIRILSFSSVEGHNNKMWRKVKSLPDWTIYRIFHVREFRRLWLQLSCASALCWFMTAYLTCVVVTYSSCFNPSVLKRFHTRFAASQSFFSMIKPYKATRGRGPHVKGENYWYASVTLLLLNSKKYYILMSMSGGVHLGQIFHKNNLQF